MCWYKKDSPHAQTHLVRIDLTREATLLRAARAGDPRMLQAVLAAIRQLLPHRRTGGVRLDVQQRVEIADALGALFMARTSATVEAAALRAALLDAQALAHAQTQNLPRFLDSGQIIDLGNVADCTRIGATQSQTRMAVIVTIDGVRFRVKDIKYGNERAAQEVMAGAVMALTGLDAPTARLAANGQHLFHPSAQSREDHSDHMNRPERFVYIASPLIPGYKDLGELVNTPELVRPEIERFGGARAAARYDAARARYQAAERREAVISAHVGERDEVQRMIGKARQMPRSAADQSELQRLESDLWKKWRQVRREKYDSSLAMFDELPEHLRYQVHMAHTAALLTHNWDEYNWGLANTGFAAVGPDSRNWRVATVDHGNSLLAGFGGRQKMNSLLRANTLARLDDPRPPNETRPEDLRPREVGRSATAIGSVPRSAPIAPLLRSMIRAESRIAESVPIDRRMMKYERELEPAIEMAYRVSMIPDEAFHSLARSAWPDDAEQFPARPYDHRHSAHDVALNLIARRNAIIETFPQEAIGHWKEKHRGRAEAAYQQVSAGVAAASGYYIDTPR